MKRIASATIFTYNSKRPFFDERIAISILKNFFLCNVFSIELEEVVFDVTYRFCNDCDI